MKANSSMVWRRRSLVATGLGLVAAAFVAGRSSAAAEGDPPEGALTYAGTFESADGVPLTGEHGVEVQLWSLADGGEMLCTSTEQTLALLQGRFSLTLPEDCTEAVRSNPDVFVEVVLDRTLMGRTKIGAVPFAVEAERAVTAVTAGTSSAVDSRSVRTSTSCTFDESDGTTNCSCNESEVAIGGGTCASCWTYATITESRRLDDNPRVWRLACDNEGVRERCDQFTHALCLRVVP